MSIANLISLLSGIALFLFGMALMGDGLKKVAGNKLEVILFRLAPKTWSRPDYAVHPTAEECVTVLSGRLTVDCVRESYDLSEGDSIYLRSNQPHKVFNPGDDVAVALSCLTPPVH